jgi:hypothetical protein
MQPLQTQNVGEDTYSLKYIHAEVRKYIYTHIHTYTKLVKAWIWRVTSRLAQELHTRMTQGETLIDTMGKVCDIYIYIYTHTYLRDCMGQVCKDIYICARAHT